MSWSLAPSLVTLREQVNNLAPNRSKRADGTIGDAAHAATKSDHNPDAGGVVRAFDITHDPAGGLDVGALAAAIVASRDNRISYMIFAGRVIGQKHWTWTRYDGPDPHNSHLHVSVVADARALSSRPWTMPTTREDTLMSEYTPEQLEKFAGVGVHGQRLGRSDLTIGVALERAAVGIPQLLAQVAGLTAAVKALAAGQGDPGAIGQAVGRAVTDALDDYELRLSKGGA